MLIHAYFLDSTLESVERTVYYLDAFSDDESNLASSAFLGFGSQTNEFVDLSLRNGFGLDCCLSTAKEAQHVRDITQEREALIAEVALNEQITGEEVAFLLHAFTVLERHHFLPRDEHLRHVLAEERRRDERIIDVLLYLVLLAADRAQYVPLFFVFCHKTIYDLTIYDLRLEQPVNKGHDVLKAQIHKPHDERQDDGSNQYDHRALCQLLTGRPAYFVDQFVVRFFNVFYKSHISRFFIILICAPQFGYSGVLKSNWKLF